MMSQHRGKRHRWTIPVMYSVFALIAGILLPRMETALLPGSVASMSPAAAMAIFTSIGSGMIALTGIVFSLAFVMIQFSATAYSPRLVMWIAGDPVIWHAIGVFTATFLYSLAATAWIDRTGSGAIPFFSTWLVIILLLASVAMFIALIDRISLLQVHRMLAFTGKQGWRVVDRMYPPLEAPISTPDPGEYQKVPVTQTLIYSGRPRAIQFIDVPALLALSPESGGIVEVMSAVGDTVVSGTPMIQIHGGNRSLSERLLRNTLELGEERTFEQDPKYAIRLLVDIAIKALSPAINDPATAVQALSYIQDLLLHLGQRRLEVGAFRNKEGALKLTLPLPAWEDFVMLAFDEIRFCGATSVQVMRRMKAMVSDLISALPQERHKPLMHFQQRLDKTIARSFTDSEEQQEASVEDRQGLGAPRKPIA